MSTTTVSLQPGRRYRMSVARKNPVTRQREVEVFNASVRWAEPRDGFLYFGFVPDSPMQGLWGNQRLYPVPGEWGVQSMEPIGFATAAPLPAPVSLTVEA